MSNNFYYQVLFDRYDGRKSYIVFQDTLKDAIDEATRKLSLDNHEGYELELVVQCYRERHVTYKPVHGIIGWTIEEEVLSCP